MFQSRMQSWVALSVAVLLLCATSLVHAEDTSYMAPEQETVTT